MKFSVRISTIYNCSIEQAFKTPILSDVTKVHTGFLFSPKVVEVRNDEDWGEVGSSKKIFVAKSLFNKEGFAFIDRVLEREEGRYWRIQLDTFQFWILGFDKFVGEWKTCKINDNEVSVEYSYHLHSTKRLYFPLNYLFAHLFWKSYMKIVIENIRQMIAKNEPFLYE